MLKCYGDNSRKIVGSPGLVEFIGSLRHHQRFGRKAQWPTRFRDVESLVRRPLFFERRMSFLCSGIKTERRIQTEMVLEVDHGIEDIGMVLVSLRQQYCCTQIDGASPECREQVTLELYMFDPFGICRNLNRRDGFAQGQVDVKPPARINMYHLNVAQ